MNPKRGLGERSNGLRMLAGVLLGLDLAGLHAWGSRPPRDSYAWGLEGRPEDAPARRIVAWVSGDLGPWYPSGFLSILRPSEAILGVCMVATAFGLGVLVAQPDAAWRTVGRWRILLNSSLRGSGIVRCRVRTAMVMVAFVAMVSTWESEGRKAHDRWMGYRMTVQTLIASEVATLQNLRAYRNQLEILEQEIRDEAWREGKHSMYGKAMGEAEFLALREKYREQISQMESRMDINGRAIRKYERAAPNPWLPIAPDTTPAK